MTSENYKITNIEFYQTKDIPSSLQKVFQRVADYNLSVCLPEQFNWTVESIYKELEVAHAAAAFNLTNQIMAFVVYRVGLDDVEITALGTCPDYAQRGVMKSLLQAFVQKCRNESKKIHLEVHEQNKAALGLYLASGFQIVRRRQNYYRDGGAAVVMMLS